MATVVTIPRFGNDPAPALLAEWYQPDGASVGAGDIVFRVESDHIAFDAEAESAGVFRHRALVGEAYAPGETVAYLLAIGEQLRPEDEAMPAPFHAEDAFVALHPFEQSVPGDTPTRLGGATEATSEGDLLAGGLIVRRRPEENISVLRRAHGTMPLPPSSTDLDDVLAPLLLDGPPSELVSQLSERPAVSDTGLRTPTAEIAILTAPATPRTTLRLRSHVDLSETHKLREQLAREWRNEDLSPSLEDVVTRAFARSLHERPELAVGTDIILRTIATSGELIARIANASTAPFHEAVARHQRSTEPITTVGREPQVVSFAATGIHEGDCDLSGSSVALAVGASFPWPTGPATAALVPHVTLTFVFDPALVPESVAAAMFCRTRELMEAPYALLAA